MNRLLPALAAGLALVACKPAISPGVAVFESFRYEGRDAIYQAHPLPGKDAVYNPILPGWYSDPSFCTNGEGDYFLVTSTFSYFPGVPLFHSRDLVNWKQVGHVLDRPSQLTGLGRQHTSGGIYAPDIKYNPKNRTYYMITTNVGTGNFLVKTQDPFGAWSDPILLPQVQGIDPSLFFDDDGRAYIVNNDEAPGGKPEYDGHRTIRIVEYDVENDCTIGERRIIVDKGVDPAAKPIWIEGPHLYKIDGKYFLMCAEGGTSDQHSEVVFRADSPMGEYKPWHRNPILTQRHLAADRPDPVTCTGHADLVKTPEGEWWGVFLGCRPVKGGFENLGRETFLLPVRWSEDGFPFFLEGEETVPLIVRHPGTRVEGNPTFGNFVVEDSFDGDQAGPGLDDAPRSCGRALCPEGRSAGTDLFPDARHPVRDAGPGPAPPAAPRFLRLHADALRPGRDRGGGPAPVQGRAAPVFPESVPRGRETGHLPRTVRRDPLLQGPPGYVQHRGPGHRLRRRTHLPLRLCGGRPGNAHARRRCRCLLPVNGRRGRFHRNHRRPLCREMNSKTL